MNLVPLHRSLQKLDVTFTVIPSGSGRKERQSTGRPCGSDYGGISKQRTFDQVVVNTRNHPAPRSVLRAEALLSNLGEIRRTTADRREPQRSSQRGGQVPALPDRRCGRGAQHPRRDLRRPPPSQGYLTPGRSAAVFPTLRRGWNLCSSHGSGSAASAAREAFFQPEDLVRLHSCDEHRNDEINKPPRVARISIGVERETQVPFQRRKSVNVEFAIHLPPLVRADQPFVGEPHGVERPVQIGLPEIEELSHLGKFRCDVVILQT